MNDCTVCGKSYAHKKGLNKHFKLKHPSQMHDNEDKKRNVHCSHCNAQFSCNTNLTKHLKSHKGAAVQPSSRLLCPIIECKEKFRSYKILRKHICENHNYSITKEIHEFNDINEFEQWRKVLQAKLNVKYVRDTNIKKISSNKKRCYYSCHRSYRARLAKNPTKRRKSVGSYKTGHACPSTMIVTICSEKVHVEFYPTHIAHRCDIGRMRLNDEERNKIAGKLAEGLPIQKVLEDVTKNKFSSKTVRITNSHKKSIDITDSMIHPTEDENKWLVTSCTNKENNYLVEKVLVPCSILDCNLNCSVCNICIHNFKCSCIDNVVRFNMCKHIHACARQNLNYAKNFNQRILKENDDIDIQSKCETIMGLNIEVVLDDSRKEAVTRHLDKVISLMNESNPHSLKPVADVNILQNTEPQIRFPTKKEQQEAEECKDAIEKKYIKDGLTNNTEKTLHIHSGFDHTYCA